MRSISKISNMNKFAAAAALALASVSPFAASAAKEWQWCRTGNGYFFEDKVVPAEVTGNAPFIDPASPVSEINVGESPVVFKAIPPVEGYTLRDGTNQWAILEFMTFFYARTRDYNAGNVRDLSSFTSYEAERLSGWEIALTNASFAVSPPNLYTAPEHVEIVPCFQWLRYNLRYYPNKPGSKGFDGWLSQDDIVYTNDVTIGVNAYNSEWTPENDPMWKRDDGYVLAGLARSADAEEPEFSFGETLSGRAGGWPGKRLGAKVSGTTNCVVSLYGVWKPLTCTVTLDPVFEWAEISTNKVVLSSAEQSPAVFPVPRAGGYEFKYWYWTDGEGEHSVSGAVYGDFTNDVTLTAKYEALPLTAATGAPFDLAFTVDDPEEGAGWELAGGEFCAGTNSLAVFREYDSGAATFSLTGGVERSGELSFAWKSDVPFAQISNGWWGAWFEYSVDGGEEWLKLDAAATTGAWDSVTQRIDVVEGGRALFRWNFDKYLEFDEDGKPVGPVVRKIKIALDPVLDGASLSSNMLYSAAGEVCPELPSPEADGYEFMYWYPAESEHRADRPAEPVVAGETVFEESVMLKARYRMDVDSPLKGADAPFGLVFAKSRNEYNDDGDEKFLTNRVDETAMCADALSFTWEDWNGKFSVTGVIDRAGTLSFKWKSDKEFTRNVEWNPGVWFDYTVDGETQSLDSIPGTDDWAQVSLSLNTTNSSARAVWHFDKFQESADSDPGERYTIMIDDILFIPADGCEVPEEGGEEEIQFNGAGYRIWLDDISYAYDPAGEEGGGDGGDDEGGETETHPAGFGFAATNVCEGAAVSIPVWGGSSNAAASVKVYLTYQSATAADVDLKEGTVTGGTAVPAVQNGRDATPARASPSATRCARGIRSPSMSNLKFPMTLSWESGEIGCKTISIPLVADKAIENDEFFTLQLADASGMELEGDTVSTVTVHDPGYDGLAAKIEAGTATRAELTAWEKLQKAKAPYMRGLADPASAGKVTGGGFCAAGKKTTLKASANKGFVFVGWAKKGNGEQGTENGFVAKTPWLVIDRSAKPAKNTASSTTITGVEEDATFYACFITAEEDKASIELSVDGEGLSSATDGSPSMSTNIWAGVYLEWPVAASALSAPAVKVTGLPAGLKFTAKDIMVKGSKTEVAIPANTIYGAPSAASKIDKNTGIARPSTVKVTVTTAGKSRVTYPLELTVDALPAWAVGTFNGAATRGTAVPAVQNGRDATPARASPSATRCARGIRSPSGVVSLAIAANGKISGKLLESGKTWTLSAASFDRAYGGQGLTDLSAGGDGRGGSLLPAVAFHATVVAKAGNLLATNEIAVTAEAMAADSSDPLWRGVATGIFQPFNLSTFNFSTLQWTVRQNLWKIEPWKDEAKPFAKAKAVEFDAPVQSVEPAPFSSGTVTLKFASNGAVKASGKFITGVNEKTGKDIVYSASCSSVLIPRTDGDGYSLYLYFPPKAGKFDGCAFAVELDWDGADFSLAQ